MAGSPTIGKKFAALERDTIRQWRTWATEIANGGTAPTPLDVLQAAAVLVIDGPPAAALEADAEALNMVKALDARVAEIEADYASLVAEYGDRERITEMVAEVNSELARLKSIQARIVNGSGGSYHRQQADRIRAAHPRIFGEG